MAFSLSTGTTNYTLHGKNIVHMTQGSNALHFFYDASNKPAIVEYNGTKYAYVHNLQGDIVAILDSAGNIVVQYKYDAWGRIISKTGSLASTLGTVQPFRYRGYVYDEEMELYYLRSRYYNPALCRFINADAHNHSQLPAPDGNLFCYTRNSPTNYHDSDGERPQGHFHAAVLKDIIKKDTSLIMTNTLVRFSNGSYGFADLISFHSGEVWELKRVTANTTATLFQINKYLSGVWAYAMNYSYKDCTLIRGGGNVALNGIVVTDTAVGVYAYVGNGIILYDYVDLSNVFELYMLENAAYNILKNSDRFLTVETTELQPAYSSTAGSTSYATSNADIATALSVAGCGGALMFFCDLLGRYQLKPNGI